MWYPKANFLLWLFPRTLLTGLIYRSFGRFFVSCCRWHRGPCVSSRARFLCSFLKGWPSSGCRSTATRRSIVPTAEQRPRLPLSAIVRATAGFILEAMATTFSFNYKFRIESKEHHWKRVLFWVFDGWSLKWGVRVDDIIISNQIYHAETELPAVQRRTGDRDDQLSAVYSGRTAGQSASLPSGPAAAASTLHPAADASIPSSKRSAAVASARLPSAPTIPNAHQSSSQVLNFSNVVVKTSVFQCRSTVPAAGRMCRLWWTRKAAIRLTFGVRLSDAVWHRCAAVCPFWLILASIRRTIVPTAAMSYSGSISAASSLWDADSIHPLSSFLYLGID